MLTDKVICPKCGSERIEEGDCYNTIDFDEGIKECFVGTCMDCGEEVQWDEVYKFVGYEIEGD